jgi:TonB family protein
MKRLRDREEQPFSMIDSPQSGTKRLLKTGVLSLLLHIILIVSMIPNLKSTIPKSGPIVYRVTIRPESSIPLTLLGETQVEKEENKSIQEINQRKPISNKKNVDQEIPSAQPVAMEIPLEEQKQPPQHQGGEEEIKEPIPLPIAAVLPSNTDLNLRDEDNLTTLLPPSRFEEKYQNTILESGSGKGAEMGPGGSGQRGSGNGLGLGGEGSGWGGSRKLAEIGQGGSGRDLGDGTKRGRGGSGRGGSGNRGTNVALPRYAQNSKPVYPLEAREKGYEGEALLRVEILSNGRVGQIEVKKSSGYDILDQCALATVKEWRFIPARKGGVPIPFWVNIPIKFQLL